MQDLLDDILELIIIASRAILKAVTGFIIVPLGIAVDQVKPGWEEANKTVKFFTGILLLPATTFLFFAAPWWDDFDIVD